jgi:hypothetical protein
VSSGKRWESLLFPVAVLGTAAWGSFLTTGTYERQPRIAKVALGSTLYLGSAVAVCLIACFCLASLTTSGAAQQQRLRLQHLWH